MNPSILERINMDSIAVLPDSTIASDGIAAQAFLSRNLRTFSKLASGSKIYRMAPIPIETIR